LNLKTCQYGQYIICLWIHGHAWNESWQDLNQWFEKTMEEAIKYGDHYQIGLAGTIMYAFKADMI
jgi:hypothetical protein